MTRPRARAHAGFTLLELMIALAIVGALLAVAFGGLRVALAAWTRGEDRAEVHQQLRGLAFVLSRAIGSAAPYQAPLGEAPDAVLLFRGTEARLELVTQAPPFPAGTPVAFTAVVLGVETDGGTALVVRQRVLPNREPFRAATVAFRDTGVTELAFRYLDETGAWQETWDGPERKALPHAVRVTLTTRREGRTGTLPPLTIALRAVAS